MQWFFIFVSALFGLIIGSFLNVVVARQGTGMGLSGRSKCFSCGKTLHALELVPVLSFLFQKGKCNGCGSRISSRYIFVELAAGLLFAGVAYVEFPSLVTLSTISILSFLVALLFWATLIAIVVYDMRHKIIPDTFSLWLGIAGLAALTLRHIGEPLLLWLPDFAGGFGMALFFFLLWALTRGKGMGLGDSKIALGIGWVLGVLGAIDALFFSFWVGALVGLAALAFSHLTLKSDNALLGSSGQVTMKSELPFAPFLAVAAILVYFANVHIPFF